MGTSRLPRFSPSGPGSRVRCPFRSSADPVGFERSLDLPAEELVPASVQYCRACPSVSGGLFVYHISRYGAEAGDRGAAVCPHRIFRLSSLSIHQLTCSAPPLRIWKCFGCLKSPSSRCNAADLRAERSPTCQELRKARLRCVEPGRG